MAQKNHFIDLLSSQFPALNKIQLNELIDENLLCIAPISLPQTVIHQVQNFVSDFYLLRETNSYSEYLTEKYNRSDLPDPGNKSMFMSYDFHLNEKLEPQLIEVNTNAAFLSLGYFLYELFQLPLGTNFKIDDLKNDFLEELRLFSGNNSSSLPVNPHIAIIDETPEKQKLYIEFLVYQELIRSFGWNCSIMDYQELEHDKLNLNKIDLIYNRWTDFYFNDLSSNGLKKMYLEHSCCFTPNPYEYFLQADKQRLIDIHSEELWQKVKFPEDKKSFLQSHIPFSQIINDSNKIKIWEQRKKLFFKPLNSFGSKQTYKGASISRKAFDEFTMNAFVAQEYVIAPEIEMNTPDGVEKFKYDLRCYAYKDKLQLIVARVYRGQVTNLKTKYGGFAPIKWHNL